MSMRINGVSAGFQPNGTSGGPASGYTHLDMSIFGGLPVDNQISNIEFGFTGAIGEMLVYNGEATIQIETYLLNKYGLPTTSVNN